MRDLAIILTLLMLSQMMLSQKVDHGRSENVAFSVECVQTGYDSMLITIKGKITDGWHVYSLDDSPVVMPTSFVIDSISGAEPVGRIEADTPVHTEYSPVFKCHLNYYKDSVMFTQRIHLTGGKYSINAHLNYLACNGSTCLAPASVPVSFSGEEKQEKSEMNEE